jgi:transposase-like protein
MKIYKTGGSEKLIKNSKNKFAVQKYKCKESGGTFIEGDQGLKHGYKKRLKLISMYLEGVRIRSIERLERLSNPLIIYWIKHFAELGHKEIRRRPIPDKP